MLRGDSGFCREELMAWCEAQPGGLRFRLGAQPAAAAKIVGGRCTQAKRAASARPARRRGSSPSSPTRPDKSWTRARRVVAKAEHLDKGENPRFVVTSLGARVGARKHLYEELYCARGEMENRIKEQLSLFADRLSTETMRANQLAAVLVGAGLHAGGRAAAAGAAGNRVGQAQVGYHPLALAENRRPGAPHRAARLGALLARLSVEKLFRRCSRGAERLAARLRCAPTSTDFPFTVNLVPKRLQLLVNQVR